MTELSIRPSENGFGGTTFAACDADAAEAALNTLCQSLAEVLRTASWPPSRVSLACGAASLEVEWPTAATAPTGPSTSVTLAMPARPVPQPVAEPAPLTGYAITAPLVGTFYRAAEPGGKPFVEIGDVVRVGQQVAIVEAMKLMNTVEADQAGRVVEILASDCDSVEYGQPLILLQPLGEE
jgi:acetyl-CoA carboxylase biotin carboxyl carrier protein